MKYLEFKRANSDLIGDPLMVWIDDPGTTDQDVQNEIGLNPWMATFDDGESKTQTSSFQDETKNKLIGWNVIPDECHS